MLKTLTKEKKIGGCFQLLFLQIFFLPFLSFSSMTPIISMLVQVFQALFIFLHSFFFLLLRLDNFIWPIHKFTDSFFCLLKSVIKLLYWFFFLIVLIVLFNFFFPVWFDIWSLADWGETAPPKVSQFLERAKDSSWSVSFVYKSSNPKPVCPTNYLLYEALTLQATISLS